MRSEAFDDYVAPAREGARGAWRILATLLLLLGGLILGTLLGFFALGALGDAGLPRREGPEALFATLFGLAMGVPTLWLGVRWLHRRSFSRVLGAAGGLRLRGVMEGAALALGLVAITQTAALAAGWMSLGRIEPPEIPIWMIVALALVVPFQAAAEELIFRGYLVQELAARSRFVLVWLLPPAALFTALHVTPDDGAADGLRIIGHISAFALFTSALVWLTGGLSHAIGVHTVSNWMALLIFQPELGLSGVGFIATRTEPGAELSLFLLDIAGYAASLPLAALLFRRETAASDRSEPAHAL